MSNATDVATTLARREDLSFPSDDQFPSTPSQQSAPTYAVEYERLDAGQTASAQSATNAQPATGTPGAAAAPQAQTRAQAMHPQHRRERNHLWGPQNLGTILTAYGKHVLIPLVLAIGMGLAYLGAFHSPTPHEVPVGIVGSSQQTELFAQKLTDESDGKFVAHVVGSADEARQQVREGTLAGAFVAQRTQATIIVGTTNSPVAAEAVQKLFGPIAFERQLPVQVDDVMPTGANDGTGQGLFFMLVGLSIGGYTSALVVAAFAARLKAAWTGLAAVVTTGVIAALSTVIAGPIFGVVTNHAWQIFLISWLYVLTVTLFGVALHPVLGSWTTPTLTIMFVMLNFTSSGGILPSNFQPGIFQGLNQFWIGRAWVDMARGLQYNPWLDLGRPALTLCLWTAAAIVLILVVRALRAKHSAIVRDRAVSLLEEEENFAA